MRREKIIKFLENNLKEKDTFVFNCKGKECLRVDVIKVRVKK